APHLCAHMHGSLRRLGARFLHSILRPIPPIRPQALSKHDQQQARWRSCAPLYGRAYRWLVRAAWKTLATVLHEKTL
ncbi:hypothetical protein E4U24_000144, partial [Claviceps purpurea]